MNVHVTPGKQSALWMSGWAAVFDWWCGWDLGGGGGGGVCCLSQAVCFGYSRLNQSSGLGQAQQCTVPPGKAGGQCRDGRQRAQWVTRDTSLFTFYSQILQFCSHSCPREFQAFFLSLLDFFSLYTGSKSPSLWWPLSDPAAASD